RAARRARVGARTPGRQGRLGAELPGNEGAEQKGDRNQGALTCHWMRDAIAPTYDVIGRETACGVNGLAPLFTERDSKKCAESLAFWAPRRSRRCWSTH